LVPPCIKKYIIVRFAAVALHVKENWDEAILSCEEKSFSSQRTFYVKQSEPTKKSIVITSFL
jgi:hypothetical protein